jgi:hypothetical protein
MITNVPTHTENKWQWFHTVSIVVIVLVIILLASSFFSWPLTKSNPASTLVTWWIMMLLLALFVFIVGHGITGKPLGALIDEQNKMSLARLQLVVWTIVILSAWITAVLWNILINKDNPLMIGIPQQVWLLLGISTATLVGTPLVLNPKKNKSSNSDELTQQLYAEALQRGNKDLADRLAQARILGKSDVVDNMNREGLDKLGLVQIGQLIANKSPALANLGNLFQGDEVGNFVDLDMGKLQLFFFTLILVLTYAVALGTMFASIKAMNGITMFPALDDSMVALLGISHAGNLINQGISHSASPSTNVPGS